MCKMINVWHFLQAWLPIEQQTRIKMRCFQYIRNMVKGGSEKKKKTFAEDEDWVNYKLDNLVYSNQKIRQMMSTWLRIL